MSILLLTVNRKNQLYVVYFDQHLCTEQFKFQILFSVLLYLLKALKNHKLQILLVPLRAKRCDSLFMFPNYIIKVSCLSFWMNNHSPPTRQSHISYAMKPVLPPHIPIRSVHRSHTGKYRYCCYTYGKRAKLCFKGWVQTKKE